MLSVKEQNINRIKAHERIENPTYILHAQHTEIGVGRLKLLVPVHIREGCSFDLTGNITVGKNTEISKDVKIFTHKHDWSRSRGLRKNTQTIDAIDLVVGDDVFIGENAMILAVSSIGEGAIIGAGAVLTKDVPAYEIWAGNPAVKINERKEVVKN